MKEFMYVAAIINELEKHQTISKIVKTKSEIEAFKEGKILVEQKGCIVLSDNVYTLK